MDFEREDVSAALLGFQQEVRSWISEQMLGSEHLHWEDARSVDDNEQYIFRKSLAEALGARGWLFPTLPIEYGGAALTGSHQIIIDDELERYGLDLVHVLHTVANHVVPCILEHGTESQKQEFLVPMARGTVCTWEVLTEPQSGSDVANVMTTAIRDGDEYVLRGQKVMVGHKRGPDFLWVLVATDPNGKRHENLGCLYIPADLPGITIQKMPMLAGTKNAVFFDDARVPARCLIGGENNGWKVMNTHMELEHGGGGSLTGDPIVERLFDYCRSERRGDAPLIADPTVRSALAEALIESHAVRLLNQRNYWNRLNRSPIAYGGPQAKYLQRMVRMRNAHRVQEIIGYQAFVADLEVHESADFEHLVRVGPGYLHGGGTIDTDRLIIARRMGLGRENREQAALTI